MKTTPESQAEALVKELSASVSVVGAKWERLAALPVTRQILDSGEEVRRAVVRLTVDLIRAVDAAWDKPRTWRGLWYVRMLETRCHPFAAMEVSRKLLQSNLGYDEDELAHLLAATSGIAGLGVEHRILEPLVRTLEAFIRSHGASSRIQAAVRQLRQAVFGTAPPERRIKERLKQLLPDPGKVPIQPGEAWSDAALRDLESMAADVRPRWAELIRHCRAAPGSAPSPKWNREAEALLDRLGTREFRRRVLAWFPLVDAPRTQAIRRWVRESGPDPNWLILEPHADLLKGLAWCGALREDRETARALTALALSAYRKIPNAGPRAVKIGNACVLALGAMPGMDGVGQLAVLQARIRSGAARKSITKALDATARRVGLPREDLEEMSVPTCGLTRVGHREEVLGGFTARMTVTGGGVDTLWIGADGRVRKSVPAALRKGHAEALKDLQDATRDVRQMLPAQRARLDTLFLQRREWPLATWRERYLDHPLVGVLARRLLWEFTTGKHSVTGIWFDPAAGGDPGSRPSPPAAARRGVNPAGGALVDSDLRPLTRLGPDTVVRLWHPVGRDTDEILAWRAWLDEQRIRQPFKQAHREVYLLTDAERRTGRYSNRFAAHVLRQHPFNALCGARGWRNTLRLMVDAGFPPATLLMPRWNLRAEFWIEGAGDDFGTDTSEAGTFRYVTTDQVRFYPLDAAQVEGGAFTGPYAPRPGEAPAEPLPLDTVPPLVFSEVMRDVDLFVSVASVGNDPNWADGRLDGSLQGYWQQFSFGDLGETAKTRRDVLARLLPRLRIAAQCSLSDRFLLVHGSLGTYRIHLGSGNVLMEPGSRYLCIVPRQEPKATGEPVFLPFEGDPMLSVILSKAFLLAADAAIRDPTLLSQIRRTPGTGRA